MIDSYTGRKLGCYLCRHFDQQRRLVCKAFPSGIPQVILSGQVAHIESFPGDNGIQFEIDAEHYNRLSASPADQDESSTDAYG